MTIFSTCYICQSIFCTCTYSHHFVHVGINVLQSYLRKFELCICVQVWGDYPCPMYEIINDNIKMLHFGYSIMSHAKLIL